MRLSKPAWAGLVGPLTAMIFLLGIALRPALASSFWGLALLLMAAVAVSVVQLLVIRLLILSPLNALCDALSGIRGDEDYSIRLAPRTGHLAALADEIDSLVEALELTSAGRRRCENRLRALYERNQIGVVLAGQDGAFIECNDAMVSSLGYSHSEIPNLDTLTQRFCKTPAQRAEMEKLRADMQEGRATPGARLITLPQRDATSRDVLVYAAHMDVDEGYPHRYALHFVDVTAFRAAEEDLRLLRRAIDAIPMGMTITDASGRVAYTNPAEASMHGYGVSDLIGREARVMAPRELWNPIPLEQIAGARNARRESVNITADGEEFPVRLTSGVIAHPTGQPAGLVTSCEDIREARRSERIAMEREQRYRDLVESSPHILCTHDPDGVLLSVNRAAVEIMGRQSPEDLIGRRLDEFLAPFARRRFAAYLDANRLSGRADGLTWLDDAGGPPRVVEFHSTSHAGSPPVIRLMARDVTERRRVERTRNQERRRLDVKAQALTRDVRGLNERLYEDGARRRRLEAALRDSEKRFRSLFEDAPVGIYRATCDGRIVMANPALINMLGCSVFEEIATVDLEKVGFGPGSRSSAFAHLMDEEGKVHGLESVWARRDGISIVVREHASAVRDPDGELLCYQGIVEDITHRRSLEEQLRQSLKMEALGRLAGGVAHDFNNILTGIIGYSDLSLMRLKEGEPVRRNVVEIKRAAERATNLTRQLLAFSRKQILQPKVLDINSVVADMEKMLKRLMGEDILLVTKLDPTIGLIEADPGQIEQVVLNLVVNARDAMPAGGTVTIATSGVEAAAAVDRQPQVILAVSDTGCGMAPEVKARLFEPFFTTKEKGTGLGLSTVYGIVNQSKGSIYVLSEVGMGTTFEVCLPMVERSRAAEVQPTAEYASARGNEVVLLVEDDDVVRQVAREALELSGFTVLLAPHGAQAMATCEAHRGPIHLMVTDVVMPGMNGPELANRVASLRPETRVLFVSGYTDDQISHHGVLAEGIAFLQKPFTPETLVRKVREVLDAAPRG